MVVEIMVDIELSDEAKEIFELKQNMAKKLKNIVDNNIDSTHITKYFTKRVKEEY